MNDYRGQITPGEAAKRLDVSPQRVRQLLADGALLYERTPLGRLVDAASVEAFRAKRIQRHAERAAVVS